MAVGNTTACSTQGGGDLWETNNERGMDLNRMVGLNLLFQRECVKPATKPEKFAFLVNYSPMVHQGFWGTNWGACFLGAALIPSCLACPSS